MTASRYHRQRSPPPTHSSSSKSLHSHVQDVVFTTRDRLQDVVSLISKPPESNISSNNNNTSLKDGWDALMKIMFAPCVNIGGVPREDIIIEGVAETTNLPRTGNRSNASVSVWGASIPFEVSTSSLVGQSLVMSSSSLDKSFAEQQGRRSKSADVTNHPSTPSLLNKKLQQQQQQQQQDPPCATEIIQLAPSTSPWEQRKAQSRAKLRQLGARHQLASGFSGDSLADIARPITPGEEDETNNLVTTTPLSPQPELVDFDDGISAISSHTLEEMERRRLVKEQRASSAAVLATTTVLRLHPLDFSQIIDEDCEWNGQENNTTQTAMGLRRGLDAVEEADETEVVFGAPFYEEKPATSCANNIETTNPSDLNRVPSIQTNLTLNTTVTEDTHEFEDMCRRQEALYWTNQDEVAHSERASASLRATVPFDGTKQVPRDQDRLWDRSSSGRLSIEERARRLRELSRSRSRSDGSGSSNKSGSSSLLSGRHPHDTIPLYSSDLFPTPSSRKCTNSSRSSNDRSRTMSLRSINYSRVAGEGRNGLSTVEGSYPFDLSECSEI